MHESRKLLCACHIPTNVFLVFFVISKCEWRRSEGMGQIALQMWTCSRKLWSPNELFVRAVMYVLCSWYRFEYMGTSYDSGGDDDDDDADDVSVWRTRTGRFWKSVVHVSTSSVVPYRSSRTSKMWQWGSDTGTRFRLVTDQFITHRFFVMINAFCMHTLWISSTCLTSETDEATCCWIQSISLSVQPTTDHKPHGWPCTEPYSPPWTAYLTVNHLVDHEPRSWPQTI